MDRDFLRKKAFSLTEIALGLAVVVLLLVTLWPLGMQIITKARVVQTDSDLNAVGQACQQYYMRFGQWPHQSSDLQPYFLSAGIHGANYVFHPQPNILTVSLGANSITVVKPRGFIGWLN